MRQVHVSSTSSTMMDPVVSSRYGKRPLLDIPPMSVTGYGHLEVPSLNLTGVHNNEFSHRKPDVYNVKTEFKYSMDDGGLPPPHPVHRYRDARPYNTAPNAHSMGRQYFYGPNGEQINSSYPSYQSQYPGVDNPPQPTYPGLNNPPNPTYPSVNNLPHPTYPGVGPTGPTSHSAYPGVVDPYGSYQQQQPSQPGVQGQGNVPKIMYDHSDTTTGFNKVTCLLEYGRITNIDIRDSRGEFKGIPPFLRDELLRTYGKYPFTEVKLQNRNGEFHIFASHDPRRRGRGKRQSSREEQGDSLFDDYYYKRNRNDYDGYDYDDYSDYSHGSRGYYRDPYFQEGFGAYR